MLERTGTFRRIEDGWGYDLGRTALYFRTLTQARQMKEQMRWNARTHKRLLTGIEAIYVRALGPNKVDKSRHFWEGCQTIQHGATADNFRQGFGGTTDLVR
jgi:hypothetical protein